MARVSEVGGPLKRPGSGLTGFGAFAFDDESARESVLIVPSVIIGKDLDGGWITTLSALTEPVASAPHEALPTAEALGENVVASFVEPDGEAAAYREGVLQAASRIASPCTRSLSSS